MEYTKMPRWWFQKSDAQTWMEWTDLYMLAHMGHDSLFMDYLIEESFRKFIIKLRGSVL